MTTAVSRKAREEIEECTLGKGRRSFIKFLSKQSIVQSIVLQFEALGIENQKVFASKYK
jgi:hypothetical protein